MHKELNLLIRTAAALSRKGYAAGGGGNVSIRTDAGIYISGSGTDLEELSEEDFALLPAGGKEWQAAKGLKPSKEYAFHTGIYEARPDLNCVLHFHPPQLTAVSTLIPDGENTMPVMIPYFVIRVRGFVQVPYYMPGSKDLSDAVVDASRRGNLINMRSHGTTALGASLDEASRALEQGEDNARIALLTRMQGEPLTPDQIHELKQKYW